MIRPNKHSHPDKTVVAIATLILGRLRGRRTEKFESLLDFVKKRQPDAIGLFVPSLNLLFLLGLLEYRKKNDTFEYTGG